MLAASAGVKGGSMIDYTTWTTAQLFSELVWANGTDMDYCDDAAVEELAKRIGLKRKEIWDGFVNWEEADAY